MVPPFLHHISLTEGKRKTPWIAHLLCHIPTCVENSSNKDSHLAKPTVPKVTQYPQERTFPWHTRANCPECAPIRPVSYRLSHVTLVGPNSTKAKNIVKSTVSVFFASLCTKTFEPTWASPWNNCRQSHALSTNNEVSMVNVENVHCCSSSSVVLSLVYVMQHSTSAWIHIRKTKHTPNSTVSVLFKAQCTLDLKPRGPAKWSNCAKYLALCTGNKDFQKQKFGLSIMCTSQCGVR